MKSKRHDARIPHFLRVTRALALVSGALIPIATVACGGSTYDGRTTGTVIDPDASGQAYDGQVLGVGLDPDSSVAFYDGQVFGVRLAPDSSIFTYDGQVMGVAPAPDADVAMDATTDPDAADAADAGHIPVGGPLMPPELPS